MTYAAKIEKLQKRIAQDIRATPVIFSPYLSRELDSEISLKLEMLQYTGAFKVRGAISKMLTLSPEQLSKGVVARTMGNHGLGVAYAAKLFGTSAKIFVPSSISELKKNALKFWGAETIIGGADLQSLRDVVTECAIKEDRVVFHPFDDEAVIDGQATLGVEMLRAVTDLEAVVVSIGGGGLISGIAKYLKSKNPKIKIYGVETIGAHSMSLSLEAGEIVSLKKVDSIADSIGVATVCKQTFLATQMYVEEVVTVSDKEAIASLEKLVNYEKVFCEPAASCTLAAIEGPLKEKIKGKKTVLLLCGGNFSLSQLKAI